MSRLAMNHMIVTETEIKIPKKYFLIYITLNAYKLVIEHIHTHTHTHTQARVCVYVDRPLNILNEHHFDFK